MQINFWHREIRYLHILLKNLNNLSLCKLQYVTFIFSLTILLLMVANDIEYLSCDVLKFTLLIFAKKYTLTGTSMHTNEAKREMQDSNHRKQLIYYL